MASAAEGASAKQGIAANLAEGIDTLSGNDSVTFTKYIRLVLPLDGSVFWVKADLVTRSALMNAMELNDAELNEAQLIAAAAPTVTVKGSFHYSTNKQQNEAEIQGVNTVIFSAESPIQEFNDIQSNTLWIGTYAGDDDEFDAPITFAFSQRGAYYKEADIFHYRGIAVLPVMRTQLIDSVDVLAQRPLIVSNSLPMWLAISSYKPVVDTGISTTIPLYPSFLIPDNLPPPYGAVHIDPRGTFALQSAPRLGPMLGHHALCTDKVRITLYGCDNEAALSFLDAVNQYSYNTDAIGIMNMPAPMDEKMTQNELNVIAQKKTIEIDVSYYQNVARNVARQLIKSCIVEALPQPIESALVTVNAGD